jgi:hypothetical protein
MRPSPVHEPDARQCDIRGLGQTRHDALEKFSDGADLGQFEEAFLERVKLRRVIGGQVHACVIAQVAMKNKMGNRQGKHNYEGNLKVPAAGHTTGLFAAPGFGSWRDFASKSSGCFFENQAHFVMKNAFATNCLPAFLIARALTAHFAGKDGPAFDDSLPQLPAEVKTPALAQDTGTVKAEHRPRRVEVCSIPEAVSPRDDLTLKVKEIHRESF